MILPPQVLAVVGAGLLIAGVAGGYKVRDWQCDAALAKTLEASMKQEREFGAALDLLANRYEDNRANDAELNTTDTGKIRDIYRTRTVLASCAADDDTASVLAGMVARANAAASGEPRGEMPETP